MVVNRLMEQALVRQVQARQDPVTALEDLLDELSWSVWIPGVKLMPQERLLRGATFQQVSRRQCRRMSKAAQFV